MDAGRRDARVTVVGGLATLLAAVTLGTGCGAADPGQGVPDTRTPHERAVDEAQLAFARCMRAEGIDYPDPKRGPDGAYLHEPPPEGQRAAYNRAGDACAKHWDAIDLVPLNEEEQRSLEAAIERDRQASICMRRKGYDFPDPIPDQGAWYDADLEAAGIDIDAPQVARDLEACEAEARGA